MPFIHRPMGRGSGALTWWESFEVAKVAWHRGGGGGGAGWREPSCPSSPRQKGKERREEGVGGGSGSSDLQNPPPPPPPGRPSREARTVSSRTARTTLPPPPFFSCQRLSQRARTYGDCAAFLPLGKKRTGSGKEEKAKRRTPRARSALRATAGRGDAAATATADSLSPRPCSVCQWEREPGHSILGTQRLLAATAAAGRRDSGEKGPATAFPSSAAPAGPLRRPGTGKQGGAEAQEKRAAARPPVDAAPGGAWRQLCRVTRWEDCRARRPGGLGTSCKKGPRSGAPPHSSLSSRRPGAGEKDLPITAAASGGRVLAASSDRARRSGAVAGPQPQRPPQRRARGLRHLRFSLQSDLRPLPPLPSTFPARPSQATVPAPLLPLLAFASPRSGGCGGPRRGEDGQAADA